MSEDIRKALAAHIDTATGVRADPYLPGDMDVAELMNAWWQAKTAENGSEPLRCTFNFHQMATELGLVGPKDALVALADLGPFLTETRLGDTECLTCHAWFFGKDPSEPASHDADCQWANATSELPDDEDED